MDYKCITEYTREDEMECGNDYAKLEEQDPEMAKRVTDLCKVLGLYGFWYRVNSARWEIAKALIEERRLAKGE